MGAMPGTADPRALAERMLDRMRAQKLIVSGGVWLRTDGPITLLAHSGLGPQSILRSITMIIEDSALATLAHTQGDWQGDWHGQPLTILPFKAGETYIGALAVITDAPPTEQECMALQAIRAHLSLALAHALLHQLDPLESTDRAWDEFLSHAAHEIKNPLASIKGYADLLLRRTSKDPADPTRKGLTIISQQVVRTTALLELCSDISRIGAERLQLDRHSADLAAIIRQSTQEYQETTPQHQITLDDPGAALTGHFDAARMHQVVGAMLSNAVKFSPNGGQISVRVERTYQGDTPAATLSIHDHGIGVPAGEQEHIFERFFRGSNVRGTFSGLGISLFVARAIVALHGGRMWLESAPELGTTCFVALPLG
jgi:signal transduction histidine kinase